MRTERDGVGVGGTHEGPAAGEVDASAVDLEDGVATAEAAGDGVRDAELGAVGAGEHELGRGEQGGEAGEVGGEGLGAGGEHGGDAASAEDGVVEAVVVLGEEKVGAALAAEEDALVAHLALGDGVAGGGEDGDAAARLDVANGGERGLGRRSGRARRGGG